MTSLGNVLIVDDSGVYREMIATVMAPHCDATLTASSGNAAIELLRSGRAIDLVLCDVMMSDGDGFDVLEHVSAMESGAPIVVMVTAYPRERAAERAFDLGAVAYLSKPTTVRSILTAVGLSALNERRELNESREVNARWRCSGKAYLLEGEHDSDALVSWDVYNLSATGAFLETKGPLPLGAEMNLLLSVGGHKARVRTCVARVQEPSWINVGGVGVTFTDSSAELESLLEGAIQSMEPEAESER